MMILTCPNCATRFFVEPDSIGPAGRRVKCGNCTTEWVAYRADAGEPAGPARVDDESTFPPSAPMAADREGTAREEPAMVVPEPMAHAEPETYGRDIGTDESAPEPKFQDPHPIGRAPLPTYASVPETVEPAGASILESSTGASDGSPMFSGRPAGTPPRPRNARRDLPLFLLLLLLALAIVAGTLYYRSHLSPAPVPTGASDTRGTGAAGG